MKYRPRIYYTEEQKALMWDRWQKGETLHAIARLFDRSHGSIAGILSRTGGIRPALRRRSRVALTLDEREEISDINGVGDDKIRVNSSPTPLNRSGDTYAKTH